MGLFGKKTDDDVWQAAAVQALADAQSLTGTLSRAARAVAEDPILGWATQREIMESLAEYEQDYKSIERQLKAIGSPRSAYQLKDAKRALDAFRLHASKAFHWGKYHYNDASGGPGQRAIQETGRVQRAAQKRIVNNGSRFADNALKAAAAVEAASRLLGSPAVTNVADQRPVLIDVFLYGLTAAEPKTRTFGDPYHEFTAVAMVGSYLFQQAATLGAAKHEYASELCTLVLVDPTEEAVNHFREQSLEVIGALEQEASAPDNPDNQSPGMYFLRFAFPEVYEPGAMFTNRQLAEQRLEEEWSLGEARTLWSQAVAQGLGFGLFAPVKARRMLESEFEDRDPDRWAEAHAAGLAIPEQPPDDTLEERTEMTLGVVAALVGEYYPEMVHVFEESAK